MMKCDICEKFKEEYRQRLATEGPCEDHGTLGAREICASCGGPLHDHAWTRIYHDPVHREEERPNIRLAENCEKFVPSGEVVEE